MKSSSHSDRGEGSVSYESGVTLQSVTTPGVSFTIVRMSFGRRMELFRRIRQISAGIEYLEASTDLREQIEANLLAQEIENLYIQWGLLNVRGLEIDGEAATAELLIERGPEDLAREVASTIKAQCGLSEDERKN